MWPKHTRFFGGAARGRKRPRSDATARPKVAARPSPLAAVSAHACDAPSAGPRLLRARAIAALMRRVPDSPRGRAECPPRGAVPLKGAEGKDGSARQTLLLAQRFLKTVEKL